MVSVRIEHPSDSPPGIDPPGTGDAVPEAGLAPSDQGTVDFVPLKPHDMPTGVYVSAVGTLVFNPFMVDEFDIRPFGSIQICFQQDSSSLKCFEQKLAAF